MTVTAKTSAKGGKAHFQGKILGEVEDIQMNDVQEVETVATSSTGGQKTRVPGHQDASGSFVMMIEPAFSKGATGDLVLFHASGSAAYNGGAIVEGIEKMIPIGAGTALRWRITWGQMLGESSGEGTSESA